MNIIEFEKRYKALNSAQKEAVDSIEGPVMVIAGPGTGKTSILTLRIANIVRQTDTDPENILALTFTESGALAMRKNLAEIMGADAYLVNINTFHGFSNNIIKDYPEYFERIIGSEAIVDSLKIKLFEDILNNYNYSFKKLRPSGDRFYYLKSIIGAISDLKREGVDVENYKKYVEDWKRSFYEIEDLYHNSPKLKGQIKGKYANEENNIIKNEDLAYIYEVYENLLQEKRLYDFEDMIMEVKKGFLSNNSLLLSLQEKYHYILADEHQDSNKAQNTIIELLANFYDNPNLFIVGDEKQSIFRFQGASIENFRYFKERYPSIKLIELEENYRSTKEILEGAYSLIKRDKKLKSNSGTGEKIKIFEFENEEAEECFIAEDISNKIKEGTKPGNIAVLYRENKNAVLIARALSKYEIPFLIESDNNLMADGDIRKIITLMKAVWDFDNQSALVEAMHISYFKIEPIDIYKILLFSSKKNIHIGDAISDGGFLENIGLKNHISVKNFADKFFNWKKLSKNGEFMDIAESIIMNSGSAQSAIAENSIDKIAKISDFYGHIRDFAEKKKEATFDDFMLHLSIMEKYGIPIKRHNFSPSENKILLMTAHKSKGREFDFVYIARSTDNLWENKRKPEQIRLPHKIYSLSGRRIEQNEKIDDDRKLFYVAITRAKKEVKITYSKTGQEGKEQLPTVFIYEIKKDIADFYDIKDYPYKIFDRVKDSPADFLPVIKPIEEIKELVKKTFEERGLSATDINSYLECPWKYFYTRLFKIPEKQERHLIYGNAIHSSLKDFFDSLKEKGPQKDYLLKRFKYHLFKEVITNENYYDLLEKGEKSLSVYFETYRNEWDKDFIAEFSIKGVEIAPGITINGRIDRMETIGFSNEVIVSDFKTGKIKSFKEIAGETKNSDGNIKRQLLFYKILLDGYKGGKYKMIYGQIDFIDPDEKGRCKREKFVIEQKEADELKKEIIKIADEILTLAFWNKKCDNGKCPYCKLKETF